MQIRNLVVPTDFSALANAAAARAVGLARLDGAAVHVVHALAYPLVMAPDGAAIPASVWDDLRRGAMEQLEKRRKAIEAQGVQTVTAELSESQDPVAAIRDAVHARSADLIVMGTHGRRGLQHAFLGSVTERVLRTLDAPVLAVKEDAEGAAKPIAKILLAVDFSPHSDRAVAAAGALAARLSASVDVVHAFDLPSEFNPYLSEVGVELERRIEAEASTRLASVREQLEKHSIRVNVHFRRGRPDTVIADAATRLGSQLIAMGTRGRSGLSHILLGSVAERTLRAAPCSVLCVKAETDQANA
jgi:nucleotide-binding universal stress UspA family protein